MYREHIGHVSASKHCVNKKWIWSGNSLRENKSPVKRRNERGIPSAVLLVLTSTLLFVWFCWEGFHTKIKQACEYVENPCLKQPPWWKPEDCPDWSPLWGSMYQLENPFVTVFKHCQQVGVSLAVVNEFPEPIRSRCHFFMTQMLLFLLKLSGSCTFARLRSPLLSRLGSVCLCCDCPQTRLCKT